jgi:prepilin-type N-terminal cleavage/methylation domain-containing protein
MPTKGNYSAFTLIEILVVIAVLGILAAVVGPNIGGWNCRQEIRNDFERINGFLETVRLEAVNRNKTMMAHYNRNGFFRAYQVSKSCQINTSIVSTDIPDLILNKKDIIPRGSDKFRTCFNADGTSYGGQFTISRQCDGKNYQFKSKIFGATGFIEKLKYNLTTSKWDEL